MLRLNRKTEILLYLMLLSPFLAYAYTVWFKLPKTITHFFTFLVFAFGLDFFLNKKNYTVPLFAKYILLFAFYIIGWKLLIKSDRQFLTEIYYYIQYFVIFLIILIIYNTHFSDKFIIHSIIVIKLTVILASAASVIQVFNMEFLNASFYFGDEYENIENLYTFRRLSIFGFIEPNALGLAFIPLLSVLIGYMLVKNEKRYPIYLLFGGIVALLSNGRYIIIGCFLLSIQILIVNKLNIKSLIKYSVLIIIGFFFFLQLLSYLGYNFQDWYNQRLLAEGSIEETTRYKAIDNFINFFPQNPIFGIGTMTEEIRMASKAVGSSHIHVGYLSHLVYYGIVGCFFLFGFWFLLFKRLYRTAKLTNYWGSFFAFLTFLWSFATMSQSSIFYYGLIFAMVFDKYYWDQHLQQIVSRENPT